ncbi:TetR/AcrR family transcriptional regulator [Thalassobius vesicularis]|uniref:TetR/AcrR family transcriptional regulator n=1 Tax=Thalassobius vesicularis TaxID=1294297 RepID=A0A4S3MDV7_9RHOB|nr:TetR/AcrR family transcriptional regulator [Thalassobius vesicularis]THD76802.1 TetR/AcrR family transcriptional regulator [Thalassobius vesicularis]
MSETEKSSKKTRTWKQDPEAVKADILKAARAEFAEHGLSGARVQDIADRIKTSKRMIFYYFQDKERLYEAVLEEAYRSVRKAEAALNLDGLPPDQALARLVEFTFDHHRSNTDFIRLVMIENIHAGRHMNNIASLIDTNTSAIQQIERICVAGKKAGLFRDDVTPLVIHWQISAMSFFNVSNRDTFSINFGTDLFSETAQTDLRKKVVESILASVMR